MERTKKGKMGRRGKGEGMERTKRGKERREGKVWMGEKLNKWWSVINSGESEE